MINKIVYKELKISQDRTIHELVFIFDTGGLFTLSADSFQGVLKLYDKFMVPFEASHNFVSNREYEAALKLSLDDTNVVELKKIS